MTVPVILPENQSLFSAIDTATRERLIAVLRDMVTNSADAKIRAVQLLTVTTEEVPDLDTESEADDGSNQASAKRVVPKPTTNKKRKHDAADQAPLKRVKKFEMCEQCNEEFDVTQNKAKACCWHDGKSGIELHGHGVAKSLRTR